MDDMTELEQLLAREAIRDTMARYTMKSDFLQVDDFVAVFTEDAVLEVNRIPDPNVASLEGRQAIRDWFVGWCKRTEGLGSEAEGPGHVRHHLSTSLIEFSDSTTARGRTYWTATAARGPMASGMYLDTFRKSGDQWLIAHRILRVDHRSK